MGRAIVAVLVGCAVSVLVIFGAETLTQRIYPLPAGVDIGNPAAMRAVMAQASPGMFALVLCGWMLGVGLGSWVATRSSGGKPWAGGAVGGITLGAAGINFYSITHPTWFVAAALVGILLAAWAGTRAGRMASPPPMRRASVA